MNYDELMSYLNELPESELDYPFGPEVAVFKVKHKMFALVSNYQNRLSVNLKCDPQEALELRDIFDDVIAGYHMNKRHWNTVFVDGDLPEGEVFRQIDASFALVVKKLPAGQRKAMELAYSPQLLYKGLRHS